MNDSLLRSSCRALSIAFFSMLGITLGFIPLLLIFSLIASQIDDPLEVKSHFSPIVQANAQGTRTILSSTAPVVLKINVGGFIGNESLNMHTVQGQLTESREGIFKNDRVKALLIHINSPGGTVVDADGIYRAIKDYKEQYKVPVYAYVDGLCASGGMYIASACDKIFASDISLIGSVGVLSPPYFNFTGLMEKMGIESKTLAAGKGKDSLNPFRPWKSGEDENMKAIIDYYYNHFVDVVSENRPQVNRNRLVNEYGAHIFSAPKAKELGLIDEVDYTLDQTLKTLVQAIGIDDNYYQVVRLDRKITLSDLLKRESPMMTGKVEHKLDIPPHLDPRFAHQFLYLYLPGE